MHRDDLHQRADPHADAARHGISALRRMPIPTLAFIGAGKVAATLARLWFARGYRVTTIYSLTYSHAEALAQKVDAQAVDSPGKLSADLVVIAVPDDVIVTLVEQAEFAARAAIHT